MLSSSTLYAIHPWVEEKKVNFNILLIVAASSFALPISAADAVYEPGHRTYVDSSVTSALHSRGKGTRNHGSLFRQVGYAEADSGVASAVENVIRETEQNPPAAGASVGDADGVRCPESRRGLRVTNGRCQ